MNLLMDKNELVNKIRGIEGLTNQTFCIAGSKT